MVLKPFKNQKEIFHGEKNQSLEVKPYLLEVQLDGMQRNLI